MSKFKILEKEMVVPNIYKFVVHAPEIAEKSKPGQFVIFIPDEEGERVPFTISDWDRDEGTITAFIQELGVSTMKLAQMKMGDHLEGVVGPLGIVPEIKNYGTVFVGGGCYGIGAVYPLAHALKEAGNRVITVIEARSNYLFYNVENLEKVSDALMLATSDGSSGNTGKVHSILEELGEKVDKAFFMGCNFMLMMCSQATREHNIDTEVSLNALMVDGTGMCGCCRVTVGGETKYACVDGPWFNGHEVDWDELFKRNSQYVMDEAMAFHHFSIGCRQDEEQGRVEKSTSKKE